MPKGLPSPDNGGPLAKPDQIETNQPRQQFNFKMALALLGSTLASVAVFALSQYLTARGFVSVTLARILLGIAWIAISTLLILAVRAFDLRRGRLIAGIGIAGAALLLGGLEVWATFVSHPVVSSSGGADLIAKIDTSPAFAYIPDSNSTVVAFIATMTNVRYSPQTVVTNWTFDIVDRHGNRKGANALQLPKSMYPDKWIVFPDLSQHQNHPGWVFFFDEFLPDKTDSPISQGDHRSGCLFFQLHDTNIVDVAVDGAPYHLIWVGSDGRIFYIEGRLNFEADSLMQTVAGLRSGFNWGHAPIRVQGLPRK